MKTKFIGFDLKEEFNIDILLNKIIELKNTYEYLALTIVDADVIAGKEHIEAAVWHAYNKFKNKNMISTTLDTEILLFLSGKRQIRKALKAVGLTETTKKAVLICVAEKNLDNFEKIIVKELPVTINASIICMFKEKEQLIKERIFNNTKDTYDFKNILSLMAKLDLEK